MQIKIIGHTPDKDMQFSQSGPWRHFLNEFLIRDFKLIDSDRISNKLDYLVLNSYSKKTLKMAKKFKLSSSKIVMVYWEPRITNPLIYSHRIRNKFGKVLAPSIIWANKINGDYFHWPQANVSKKSESYDEWIKRDNVVVNVISNKFSPLTGENYSLRREVNKRFSAKYPNKIDLYGMFWNHGFIHDLTAYAKQLRKAKYGKFSFKSFRYMGVKYTNYQGSLVSKNNTVNKYRISLVIENSSDYVSEKLFDAISSQSIVIYVGPRLEVAKLNQELVVTAKPNYQSIEDQINKILNMPAKTQFKLMLKQQKIAKQLIVERVNTRVLGDLAKQISTYFLDKNE